MKYLFLTLLLISSVAHAENRQIATEVKGVGAYTIIPDRRVAVEVEYEWAEPHKSGECVAWVTGSKGERCVDYAR